MSSADIESYKFNYTYQIRNIAQLLYERLNRISSIVQIYDRRNDDESISDISVDIVEMFRELSKGTNSDLLFWIEKCNKNYIIVNCPKNINERTKNILFDDLSSIKVLTSATLNTDFEEKNFYKYFMKSVGLYKDKKLFITPPIESAFDIENNTLLYYSNDIAHPQRNHSKYIEDITKRITDLVKITEGKSLILFTAKADMRQVYNNLIKEKLPYKILIQKDGASQIKTKEEFSQDINSILLSTGTFWEGIDIKGKSLSSVIIVRLPFPVSNPVIEYKASISNNIMDVCLPEMLIKLKQGIGRLIRCDTDNGIISILDSRIGNLSKVSYKDIVFNSIRSKIKTNDLDIVKKFAKEKGIID